jgi:hypothetical protein
MQVNMALKDCRAQLFETGLFGKDDDAYETIDDILTSITQNPDNYDAAGKVDMAAVNDNMSAILKDQRIANRKRAIVSYKSLQAFNTNSSKFNLWWGEFKAQTGKYINVRRMFEALLVGWNGKETLTGGKVSVETVGARHMSNYQREFEVGLQGVIDKHGEHIKPLIGVQGNILTDTTRGVVDVMTGNLAAARRDFNLNVLRVMEGDTSVTDPVAKDVAAVLSALYKKIAADINKVGGNINITENYHPHDHNAEAMLNAGRETWKADIRNRIDWEQTYPEGFALHKATMEKLGKTENFAQTKEVDAFLDNMFYNVTTGQRNEFSFTQSLHKFSSRASRSFERARSIAFKSPKDYAEYANRFSTLDSVGVAMQKIKLASTTRAAMELLGPVPEETLKNLRQKVINDLRTSGLSDKEIKKQTDRIGFDPVEGTGRIGGIFHTVMGYADMPVNGTLFKVMSKWRDLNRMKLGAMNVSAMFGDPLTQTMQAKRVKGTPGNIFELVNVVANRFDWRDREMVDQLAIESDEFFGSVYCRFDSPDSLMENRRLMNRFVAGVMRWTGTRYLTDSARFASQKVHMRAVAKHASKAWDQLHPDVIKDMKQAGVDALEWDAMRKHVTKAGSGRDYLLPISARKISNNDLEPMMPAKFRADAAPTDPAAKRAWKEARNEARGQLRDEIEAKFKTYYIVGDRYAVIQMDARSRYWATGGKKRGTVPGEAIRVAAQFKMQPISASNLIFREGRAGSTQGGLASTAAYLGFLGTSMLLGYGMMTSKDLLSGRTPRPLNRPSTWMEALGYSGGLGFVYDMMTNDVTKYGNPLAAFGPVGGDLGIAAKQLYGIQKVMTGDMTLEEYGEKFGKDAYRIAKGWIPRLWFMRTAMDYYIFNPIEEAMTPGTMRKRERRMKKQTGQEYLLDQPAHNWR